MGLVNIALLHSAGLVQEPLSDVQGTARLKLS